VARTYSVAELAREAGATEDRVRWMADLGLIMPDDDGRFTFGAALVVKMTSG
jgi:hypothetical protein